MFVRFVAENTARLRRIDPKDEPRTSVRREAGREQEVKVLYGKGIANRTGPEPCAVDREVGGEASAGGDAGQPLSLEKCNRDADVVEVTEVETDARVIASARLVLLVGTAW